MVREGIKNQKYLTVTEAQTALRMGSGTLPVFATPAMIALMEATAAESIECELEAGQTSVGVRIDVTHLSAVPVGGTVLCKSELTKVDGRRCSFQMTVEDKHGVVGEGTHERVAVDAMRFMEKVNAKKNAGRN